MTFMELLKLLAPDWPEHLRNLMALFVIPHCFLGLLTLSEAETAAKLLFSLVSIVCLVLVTWHKLRNNKEHGDE